MTQTAVWNPTGVKVPAANGMAMRNAGRDGPARRGRDDQQALTAAWRRHWRWKNSPGPRRRRRRRPARWVFEVSARRSGRTELVERRARAAPSPRRPPGLGGQGNVSATIPSWPPVASGNRNAGENPDDPQIPINEPTANGRLGQLTRLAPQPGHLICTGTRRPQLGSNSLRCWSGHGDCQAERRCTRRWAYGVAYGQPPRRARRRPHGHRAQRGRRLAVQAAGEPGGRAPEVPGHPCPARTR
jgi:hypothetical protein